MHEIDITSFWREFCPSDYSASAAEIGQDAGADTWRAAMGDANEWPILADADALQAMRDHARASGGWSDDEIASWSDVHIRALALQWLASDLRDAFRLSFGARPNPADWPDVMARAEEGQCAGTLYSVPDGRVFWMIGE